MQFLNKLIGKAVYKVISNVTKMDIIIDFLKDKFKDQCPPRAELLAIVKQKNQIQSGLEACLVVFNPINTAAATVDGIVTTVGIAVKIIKLIPIPTSFPPGIGIPINVITILSDSLDQLDKLLTSAKITVSIVAPLSKIISDAITKTIAKLQELDILFNTCMGEIVKGTNEGGTGVPLTLQEQDELALEIVNIAATSGDFNNPALNANTDAGLLDRLSPNSSNPLAYKGFVFIVEYETVEVISDTGVITQEQEYSFPSRRIKATNKDTSAGNVYLGLEVYNLVGGRYSFSASTQVLINEAKFRIDNLNYTKYWKQWVNSSNNNALTPGKNVIAGPVNNNTIGPNPLPPSNTGGAFPSPIEVTQENWTNWNQLNGMTSNMQQQMYGSNPYKNIPYSIDIGQSLFLNSTRNSSGTLTSATKGLPTKSAIRLKAKVNSPGAKITFTVDTGEFTPQYPWGYSNPGVGDYNNGVKQPYRRGEVEIKINAASGSQHQNIKLLKVNKGVGIYTFTYPEIGTYYVEAIIWNGGRYGTTFNNQTTEYINSNQSSSLIVTYDSQQP
jgi:hypothetical protein